MLVTRTTLPRFEFPVDGDLFQYVLIVPCGSDTACDVRSSWLTGSHEHELRLLAYLHADGHRAHLALVSTLSSMLLFRASDTFFAHLATVFPIVLVRQ